MARKSELNSQNVESGCHKMKFAFYDERKYEMNWMLRRYFFSRSEIKPDTSRLEGPNVARFELENSCNFGTDDSS